MFLRDANDVGGGRRNACADGDPRVRYDGRRQYHMTPFLPQRSGNANEGFACPGARVVPVHGIVLQASGSTGRVRWSISHCVAGPHARSARLINDMPYRNTRRPLPEYRALIVRNEPCERPGLGRGHRPGIFRHSARRNIFNIRPRHRGLRRMARPHKQKTRERFISRGFFQTFIETHRSDRGAGDRTRTGKPVKAADFRHTASFKAGVAYAKPFVRWTMPSPSRAGVTAARAP